MPLKLDYFYGGEAEQYSFYRIPKVLFTDQNYSTMTMEARVLYGLLLDRMGLSARNGWLDSCGRVFIYFTLEDAMAQMQERPHDAEQIDGYVELMLEVCCSTRDFIRISKEELPTGVVKARFLKLTREHIEYVMDCVSRNTTQIGNIKAYLLAALYNAPVTIGQYMTQARSAVVSYDI